MIPAGYLLKRIVPPPGWLAGGPSHVEDVCSVADCVNDNVVDVQEAWKHNSFGLANTPETLWEMVAEKEVNTDGAFLFYYEAYENEVPSDGWTFDASQWRVRTPATSSFTTDAVEPPAEGSSTLLGYDVVVFEDYLSHSPLSCNSIAKNLLINEHCLFGSLEEAVAAIDEGAFGGGCEDGAYTVFSVNRVVR